MLKNQAETAERSIVERIHEAYESLPEGERRIADSILEAPADLALFSATELAVRSGVSNATVSRFFRRLGYPNFDVARQDARRMRATGSPLYTGRAGKEAVDPISDLAAQETALLEETLSRVNPIALQEICIAIARARRVRTLGYRNSLFLADYLTAQIAQMRPDVGPLVLRGHTHSDGIATLDEADLAIIVGLRRRPRDFVETVRAIGGRGARIILIADRTIRAAPAMATWTLDCVVDTPQFADSYVGAMALLRLIVLETSRVLGTDGQGQVERIEDVRRALRELE